MDSYKGFISPESFLNFFLNLYIPPWLQKSFNIMVVRLMANTFVSQKTESVQSPHAKCSPRFLLLPPRQKEITYSSWTVFSEDLFFPQQKWGDGVFGGRITELKKLPKLHLRGYWSQVLKNSTFSTLTFLFSVLLCPNLASSMLKCEGSLT